MQRWRSSAAALVVGGLGLLAAPALAESGGAPAAPDGRARVPAVVARVLPAVVSIITRQIERDQFNQPVATRGLGSGIIVDRRGYVLTNSHVVDGAEEIKVTLADERTYPAVLVGTDPQNDLAVLKVAGLRLPAAVLGNSARLAVGETVIAIGNPLWIEGGPTVTVGVVSALRRSMEEPGLPVLHNLVQTDAAINAGNSGGPLVDLGGRVVGINTAVIASAHGIGFAIAADTVKPILKALIATGRVVRPTLGLQAVSVTPQRAYANGLPVERGALVTQVEPGGPAEAAGVRPGDVITAVGGQPVRDLHHFHAALERGRVGEALEVRIWRDGQTLSVRPVLKADQP